MGGGAGGGRGAWLETKPMLEWIDQGLRSVFFFFFFPKYESSCQMSGWVFFCIKTTVGHASSRYYRCYQLEAPGSSSILAQFVELFKDWLGNIVGGAGLLFSTGLLSLCLSLDMSADTLAHSSSQTSGILLGNASRCKEMGVNHCSWVAWKLPCTKVSSFKTFGKNVSFMSL